MESKIVTLETIDKPTDDILGNEQILKIFPNGSSSTIICERLITDEKMKKLWDSMVLQQSRNTNTCSMGDYCFTCRKMRGDYSQYKSDINCKN